MVSSYSDDFLITNTNNTEVVHKIALLLLLVVIVLVVIWMSYQITKYIKNHLLRRRSKNFDYANNLQPQYQYELSGNEVNEYNNLQYDEHTLVQEDNNTVAHMEVDTNTTDDVNVDSDMKKCTDNKNVYMENGTEYEVSWLDSGNEFESLTEGYDNVEHH